MRRHLLAPLALAAALGFPAAVHAQDQSPCFDVEAMAGRIAASGMAWEHRRGEIWRVDMPSETREFVRVVVNCGQGVVPMFAILAAAGDLRQSEALYFYLLRAASHFDHVKLAIDSEGDYLVRIDLRPATFDASDLDAAARQIRDVVDSLTPALRADHAR